jgi:hypothetical protein
MSSVGETNVLPSPGVGGGGVGAVNGVGITDLQPVITITRHIRTIGIPISLIIGFLFLVSIFVPGEFIVELYSKQMSPSFHREALGYYKNVLSNLARRN